LQFVENQHFGAGRLIPGFRCLLRSLSPTFNRSEIRKCQLDLNRLNVAARID